MYISWCVVICTLFGPLFANNRRRFSSTFTTQQSHRFFLTQNESNFKIYLPIEFLSYKNSNEKELQPISAQIKLV